jgi:hypothetical protein
MLKRREVRMEPVEPSDQTCPDCDRPLVHEMVPSDERPRGDGQFDTPTFERVLRCPNCGWTASQR